MIIISFYISVGDLNLYFIDDIISIILIMLYDYLENIF